MGDIEYDIDSLWEFVINRRNNGFECIINDRDRDDFDYYGSNCDEELFELVYSGEHWGPV